MQGINSSIKSSIGSSLKQISGPFWKATIYLQDNQLAEVNAKLLSRDFTSWIALYNIWLYITNMLFYFNTHIFK